MSTESQSNKILPTLQIEVDIFSGRPNPKWVLTEQQTKEFLEFSQWQEMMVSEKNTKNFEFGFNGFIVTKLSDIGTDLPYSFHLVNTYRPHYHLDNVLTKLSENEMASREEWLLNTCETPQEYDETFPNLLNFIKKKIVPKEHNEKKISEKQTDELVERCPVAISSYIPKHWDPFPKIIAENNCYNYATNSISYTKAQPGRISGRHFTEYTCANVKKAAIFDGMVEIPYCNVNRTYYKIALVIAPGVDFHWYRLQNNGNVDMWGHKRGAGDILDVDANNKLITDPENCSRNYNYNNGGPNYSDFCGYFYWPVRLQVE
jgi:hypothetical protein